VRACSGVGDMGGLFFVQVALPPARAPAASPRVSAGRTSARALIEVASFRPLLRMLDSCSSAGRCRRAGAAALPVRQRCQCVPAALLARQTLALHRRQCLARPGDAGLDYYTWAGSALTGRPAADQARGGPGARHARGDCGPARRAARRLADGALAGRWRVRPLHRGLAHASSATNCQAADLRSCHTWREHGAAALCDGCHRWVRSALRAVMALLALGTGGCGQLTNTTAAHFLAQNTCLSRRAAPLPGRVALLVRLESEQWRPGLLLGGPKRDSYPGQAGGTHATYGRVWSARRYGRVYRGKYKGQEVAVKVIQDVSRVRMINGALVLSPSR